MPISTLLSLGKIVVKSRPTPGIPQKTDEEILIIGNGPSAKEFLETAKNRTVKPALFCVNKFAFWPLLPRTKTQILFVVGRRFFSF